MREIRFAIAAVMLVAAAHAVPVGATAYSIDQSDLWWNPAESGWGIQLVQRGSVIFGTMFVYAQDGSPTWYAAAMSPVAASLGEKASTRSWSGDLYAYRGTWFAAPTWAPYASTKVGTMQWTASDVTSGTLAYTVNGTPVTKQLVRELLAFDDFSGTFQGGVHDVQSGCTNPSKNGTFDDYATVTTTQTGQTLGLAIVSLTTGINCTFSGTLTQAGRFGAANGTFNCGGKMTPGSLSGMAVGVDSLNTHFNSTDSSNGCTSTGYFVGARQ